MGSIKYIFQKKTIISFSFSFLVIVGLNAYFLSKYRVEEVVIDSLVFSSDLNKKDLLVYAKYPSDLEIDFTKLLTPVVENDQFVFYFNRIAVRTFRIYIGRKIEQGTIQNVKIINGSGVEEPVLVSQLKKNQLSITNKGDENAMIFSCEQDGYLQLRYERITMQEFCLIEVLIGLMGIIFGFVIIPRVKNDFKFVVNPFSLKTLGIFLFVSSIFFPQPFFNILFMLSFLLIIRDFNLNVFMTNRAGLLFVFYFLVVLVNDIWVSKEFNTKFLETLLPVFFLPFYFSCTPRANYLRILPLTGFLLSLYFIASSLIDAAIEANMNYFSFDAFTKYIHPVYFSYLLFFSVVYVTLENREGLNRPMLVSVLLFAMLCCGSKLIISLTVFFYAIQLFKKREYLGYTFLGITVILILLFSPTRKRFQEIFDLKSLSVLRENPVPSFQDPRLNGLTLRLIIWQESLNSMESVKDFFFGRGVDKASDKILEDRLNERGLEKGHTKYDPHNQFIATYYKMGFIGFSVLFSICVLYIYLAIVKKDQLLLFSIVLFTTAMFTESVLQRVTGIYFFICILLLLSKQITNSSYYVENSDTRNEGNS